MHSLHSAGRSRVQARTPGPSGESQVGANVSVGVGEVLAGGWKWREGQRKEQWDADGRMKANG